MPKMLNDGAVEYEDGTPATEAQVLLFVEDWFQWISSQNVLYMNFGRMEVIFFHVMFCCRWGKMLCHSYLGLPNLRWKRENWYVSFDILFLPPEHCRKYLNY